MESPPPPLLRLPLEVLLRSAGGLTTAELCALRLTCRGVEERLHGSFAREFFTRRQHMVTAESLAALADLSRSRLGAHLRQLHMGLESFPGDADPLGDAELERRFRRRCADHLTMWSTGAHRAALADALARLGGLDEVVLRDCGGGPRARDGPGAEWASYGVATVLRETGCWLRPPVAGGGGGNLGPHACPPPPSSSQVFALLLQALADAGRRPRGLGVLARHGNHLRDYAFNLPRSAEPALRPVLAGLERLHLALDLSWRRGSGGGPHGNARGETRLLRAFLRRTPNLRDLRINEHHDHNSALGGFLDWPASAPAAGPPAAAAGADDDDAPPALPLLEHLSLGMLHVGAATLLAVVARFAASLRGLELWRVTLRRALPPGADPADPPRCAFWADLLRHLRRLAGPGLRHFKAGMLKQAYAHRRRGHLVFFRGCGPVV